MMDVSTSKCLITALFVGLTMFLIFGAFQTRADAKDAWGRPATESLGLERTFERLVDIEARHIDCSNKTLANGSHDVSESIQKMRRDFAACVKGEPRYSCNAPLISVQAAQLFFDEYYGEKLSYPTARMDAWLKKCGKYRKSENFELNKIDIPSLCKTSYLVLPIWYRRYGPSSQPLDWSFATRGDPGQICGRSPPIFMSHYERRCGGIWRAGSERKGRQEDYENIPLVHDYYDEVDWDVCRVLAVGSVTTSFRNFRTSDGP